MIRWPFGNPHRHLLNYSPIAGEQASAIKDKVNRKIMWMKQLCKAAFWLRLAGSWAVIVLFYINIVLLLEI